MDLYKVIGFEEYEDDDLAYIMEEALKLIDCSELLYHMDYEIPYGEAKPNLLSNLEKLKKSLIENAHRIIDIQLPYEVSANDCKEDDYETIIWDSLIKSLKRQLANGKLVLVYCPDEKSLESHLDSGCCITLVKIDDGGIVCYCDSGNQITLKSNA